MGENANGGLLVRIFYRFKKNKKTKVKTFQWKLARPAVRRKLDFGKQRLCKLTKKGEKVKLFLKAGFWNIKQIIKERKPEKTPGVGWPQRVDRIVFSWFFVSFLSRKKKRTNFKDQLNGQRDRKVVSLDRRGIGDECKKSTGVQQ